MKRTMVKEALNAQSPMPTILIRGWVRTRRDAKDWFFLEINDGSCLKNIQVIVDAAVSVDGTAKPVNTGASVEVTGELIESPGKGQKWEVRAGGLRLIGPADQETYPLQKKRHSDEFLRTIAHLRPRTNKFGAMFRIRSEASFAIHQFFRERGFFYIHTPIITGSDCEGAGDLFRVTTLNPAAPQGGNEAFEQDFFGKEAFLTVSGQLTAEALATSLGNVYTFGPTFRSENSNTPRHAAEFWMVEPEVAFADLRDNMNLAEEFLKSVIEHLRAHCAEDLELFARFVDPQLEATLDNIMREPFERVSYRAAIDILKKSGRTFEYPPEFGLDLQTEHERFLAEQCFKKPVIVYDYPKTIKAFYMRMNDDGETVAAMDVLVPRVGEIIGGSQREERPDALQRRIDELGMDFSNYWWYADLRKYGTVPHSGFGMGFERFLMMFTGVTNIRDVIPFARTPANLEF